MLQKPLPQIIRQKPKIDLHRHLDCSLRWSTVVELNQELGLISSLEMERLRSEFLVTEPMLNLELVLKKFLNTQKLFASQKILERMAFEACEDAFNDGIQILELRYAPSFIAEGGSGLSFEQIHSAIVRGVERAESIFPMAVGLICILQRVKPLRLAEEVTEFAVAHKDTFLALDLADNEIGFEPLKFAPLFQKAKAAGMGVTVHSGEAPHPDAGKWIQQSVEVLGATRIGHGIQVVHHPKVIDYLIKKNVTLEVCPYSNYLTQAFPTYESHPFRKLYQTGFNLTVNSDDPGVFASVLSDDFQILFEYQNLTHYEFQVLQQNAFQASFLPQSKKQKFAHLYGV